MSKNRNSRSNGNMNYNRPSGGYQKNLYRAKLNAEGITMPKPIDPKKFRIFAIAGLVVWVIISILLIVKLKWIGLLIALVIGALAVGGTYLFVDHKQKEMIRYYQKIGMTEEMYVNELRKRKTDPKQIETMRKLWRKVKI